MSWSKKQLQRSNLYLILDTEVLSYKDLLQVLKPAVRGGVDSVQLRDKKGVAREILEFCRQIKAVTAGRALFIVNDRVDLAILAEADGVHLGQEDIPYTQARQLMGERAIIGVSCQTLDHAKAAQRLGVDYIGFGSVFKTFTKPQRQPMDLQLLQKVMETIRVPVFPIGGISRVNVGPLVHLGVKRVAVCRGILLAKDVGKVVREFKDKLMWAAK